MEEDFSSSAEAKCFALGLVMRREVEGVSTVVHAPMTLQPLKVERPGFEQVLRIMPLWNKVVDNIARDFTFLHDSLAASAASDPEFTGRMVGMLRELYMGEVPFQPLMLGLFRSDYLLERDAKAGELEWKNVEINTTSVSFAALSSFVPQFHSFVRSYRGEAPRAESDVPRSESCEKFPAAMAMAHNEWVSRAKVGQSAKVVVCVVIQEGERNTADQYRLMHNLLEQHGVQSIRCTLRDLSERMTLEGGSSTAPPHAVVDGKFISLFYFRSCYAVGDFPSEIQWKARHELERSSAVKCPSLPHYLCTMKKIQKAICDRSTLERFCSPAEAADLSQCFVGQYGLDEMTEETKRIVADAVANPDRYVLKPQLEGGGNLIVGDEMLRDLTVTKEEDAERYNHVHTEYILMSKINSTTSDGALFRSGVMEDFGGVSGLSAELGTFGAVLADGSSTNLNECTGFLVRTKPINVADGGVMSGASSLDTVAFA